MPTVSFVRVSAVLARGRGEATTHGRCEPAFFKLIDELPKEPSFTFMEGVQLSGRRRRTTTFIVGSIAVTVVSFSGSACSNEDVDPKDNAATCVSPQALTRSIYNGSSLGSKQLALTFDDGHGTRTTELSAYLVSQGIRAGFFVNGKNVEGRPGILAQLVADGHVVGNHTQDHFDMTDRGQFPESPEGNAALVAQLTDTDALIAPWVPSQRYMFRAPYGAFDMRDYDVLHASPMDKYVGHIDWDVGGTRTDTTAADWACWQNLPMLSSKACGDLYLQEIEAMGRGIVLMHDGDYGDISNHDLSSGTGNTTDMVKYMVPILKARGYTFVRVDEVPTIAAALPPLATSESDGGTDGATDASADAGSSGGGVPDGGHGIAAGPTPSDTGSSSGGIVVPNPPPTAQDPCAEEMTKHLFDAH